MRRALIVVDIQNDFLPGGALAVPDGDSILPFVIDLIQTGRHYDLIVVTQDWHPEGHGSFASSHTGKSPFQPGELAGLPQMLWPDHCIEATYGAGLAAGLEEALAQIKTEGRRIHHVRKGLDQNVDSYSAFFDNARLRDTGLQKTLGENGITEVDIVGLALDYCVKATALDAASLGFKTRVLLQGTRAVDPSSAAGVVSELTEAGIACMIENS
ncbi:MAG: bifunctional nicotinamidase/pyrazinamidase [Desulforhopalus sp.]